MDTKKLEAFREYCERHQHTPRHGLGENPNHARLVNMIRSEPRIIGIPNAYAAFSRVYKPHPTETGFAAEVDNVIFTKMGWVNFVEVKTGQREKSTPEGKRSLVRSGKMFMYEHGLENLRLILYQMKHNGLAHVSFAHLTKYGLEERKNRQYWRQDAFFAPLEYFEPGC